MVIIKIIILVMMFSGLLCTLAPRLYGSVMILLAGFLYIVYLGMDEVQYWMSVVLLLSFVAEVGSVGLKMLLTRNQEISSIYSIDTSVCNLAGLITMNAFFGSLLGTTMWGLLVSKSLLPDVDKMKKILTRVTLIALLRLVCGAIMISIIITYTM